MGTIDKILFEKSEATGCGDSDYNLAQTSCCRAWVVEESELSDLYFVPTDLSRKVSLLDPSVQCPLCGAHDWRPDQVAEWPKEPNPWQWAFHPDQAIVNAWIASRTANDVSEYSVPVSQRYLWLDGFLDEPSLKEVRQGLPATWPRTAVCLFVGYAFAALPLGRTFHKAFPFGRPELAESTTAVLHAVTQQFAKPFDEIPHGWKTICLIDFPDGIPASIQALPTLHGWTSCLENSVCLADEVTMNALIAELANSRPEVDRKD